MDKHTKELALEDVMDTLSEQQAKFILQASVIAGHLPRCWFDKGIELSRMVKP